MRPMRRWTLGVLLMAFGLVTVLAGIFFALGNIGGIGLASFIIGLLITYLPSGASIRPELLEAYALSSLVNFERFLLELAPEGKATYLRIKDRLDVPMVFLPIAGSSVSPEAYKKTDGDRFYVLDMKDSEKAGILVEGPGASLLALVEKESNIDFFDIGREDLIDALRTGMVDSMDLVADLKGAFTENGLTLRMSDEMLAEVSQSLKGYAPITVSRLGCPICSGVICAIVKSTKKDVRVENALHEPGYHRLTLSFIRGEIDAVH